MGQFKLEAEVAECSPTVVLFKVEWDNSNKKFRHQNIIAVTFKEQLKQQADEKEADLRFIKKSMHWDKEVALVLLDRWGTLTYFRSFIDKWLSRFLPRLLMFVMETGIALHQPSQWQFPNPQPRST